MTGNGKVHPTEEVVGYIDGPPAPLRTEAERQAFLAYVQGLDAWAAGELAKEPDIASPRRKAPPCSHACQMNHRLVRQATLQQATPITYAPDPLWQRALMLLAKGVAAVLVLGLFVFALYGLLAGAQP